MQLILHHWRFLRGLVRNDCLNWGLFALGLNISGNGTEASGERLTVRNNAELVFTGIRQSCDGVRIDAVLRRLIRRQHLVTAAPVL